MLPHAAFSFAGSTSIGCQAKTLSFDHAGAGVFNSGVGGTAPAVICHRVFRLKAERRTKGSAMHYANGIPAVAGELVINLDTGRVGIIHSLDHRHQTCNGRIAASTNADDYVTVGRCVRMIDLRDMTSGEWTSVFGAKGTTGGPSMTSTAEERCTTADGPLDE